jgi:DNA helicase-2/ATP-dependent DNA helicase PcrA
MNQQLPGFPPRSFDFFFDRLDACLRKGRGFSVFQADLACVQEFSAECQRRVLRPFSIQLSSMQEGLENLPKTPSFVILVQDLAYPDFLEQASLIADRLVFPLWFRRVPICFFSALGREAYEAQPVKGEDLHRDFGSVVRRLLAEQALTLLERSNYQFASPELLDPEREPVRFTPLEETMRAALEEHHLAYQSQVRLGRQVVDFLVEVPGGKVAVECESRAQYEAAKDGAQPASLTGYPLCRFSAAEIESDVERCIRTIEAAVHYRTLPAYKMDDDLDPSQQGAVASVSGPVRVLAPAGSGKTKTLVNRILNLLNQGIAPERILALAFNKKARDEMQERLERRGVEGVEVRTFHSFGYEIVRDGLGWSFASGHQKTARSLMRAAIQEHTELPALRNRDPVDAFLAGLRQAKMELPSLATLTVEYGDKIYPLEPIFYSYVQKQLDAKFLDFDDMIYLSVRLLLENRALRCRYQSRFEFVLVDEFQDLNEAQLLLLQIIGLPENNIFAVGDDDQMIYGFRGADVKHIVEFEKRFPVAVTHVLNTNYRSSRMIVRHAGWLIGNNLDRVPKDIQPRRDAQPGRFEVAGQGSLLEQAKHAAGWLAEHKKQNNLNRRDYAVLYRFNAYQFPVAVMLDALGIPHSPAETGQLFRSAVGQDVYAYLQVMLFPKEAKPADFERVLKRPNKFLTNQLIAQSKDWISFLRLPHLTTLRDWERQKLVEFITRIERVSQAARSGEMTAAGTLQALKTELGLAEFYHEQSRLTDDLDQASDENLLDVMIALAGNYKTPLEFYQFLCKAIADREESSEKENGKGSLEPDEPRDNEVFLSTIHRAKGKEFRNVVYFNLSENPADPKKAAFVEEERRVAYVGATRPKDDLLITFLSTRPADFLREIALNPKYKEVAEEDLKRSIRSTGLRIERAKVVLKQLEAKRQKQIAFFRELTRAQNTKHAAWIQWLLDKIQLWRIDRALKRIDGTEAQIKAQKENTIAALESELQAMEEEAKMREALAGKKANDPLPGLPPNQRADLGEGGQRVEPSPHPRDAAQEK